MFNLITHNEVAARPSVLLRQAAILLKRIEAKEASQIG